MYRLESVIAPQHSKPILITFHSSTMKKMILYFVFQRPDLVTLIVTALYSLLIFQYDLATMVEVGMSKSWSVGSIDKAGYLAMDWAHIVSSESFQ